MRSNTLPVAVGVLLGTLPLLSPAIAQTWNYQDRYCAGMRQEQSVSYGGRVDCIDDEWVIETEWADDWYQAVGQILYYSEVTQRRPGIIILCRSSAPAVEFGCRANLYRLEQALKRSAVPVMVWECFPEDMARETCLRPFGPS